MGELNFEQNCALRQCQLVREAIVREIRDANRWSSVVDAWEALLSVRRKEEDLAAEQIPKTTDNARCVCDKCGQSHPYKSSGEVQSV